MAFEPAIFSVCLFLLGTTVLTWCSGTHPLQPRLMHQPSEPRQLIPGWACHTLDGVSILSVVRTDAVILFVYLDSYLFVLSTSILQTGIGLNSNIYTCESPIPQSPTPNFRAAIFLCIFFYCSSKVPPYRCPFLMVGNNLSLPDWTGTYCAWSDTSSVKRYTLLVPCGRTSSVLCHCCAGYYLSGESVEWDGEMLYWSSTEKFVSSTDIRSCYQCTPS
jgi:hypothetical protein